MCDLKTVRSSERSLVRSHLARSRALFALPLLAVAALSACVVVPLDPKTGRPYGHEQQPAVVVVQQPGAPGSVATNSAAPAPSWNALNARLYPINDTARLAGPLSATVLDNGSGRGSFNVSYGGQAMQGEATRVDRNYPGFGQIMQQVQGGANWSQTAGQRGIANAASSRASMRCEYLFTAPGQGTGACVMSDGARYQIHFGG
jgi:hypothetical protein